MFQDWRCFIFVQVVYEMLRRDDRYVVTEVSKEYLKSLRSFKTSINIKSAVHNIIE